MNYICDICGSKLLNKSNLVKHKKTESCLKIKKELEYNKNITELNDKVLSLEQENVTLKKQNEDKDIIIKTLEDKAEDFEFEHVKVKPSKLFQKGMIWVTGINLQRTAGKKHDSG